MQRTNEITVDGNGNITLQDLQNSPVTINMNDSGEILGQLRRLNETQIERLLKVSEELNEQMSQLFKTYLENVAIKKNVAEKRLTKELTDIIPRTHPDDIVGREEDLG